MKRRSWEIQESERRKSVWRSANREAVKKGMSSGADSEEGAVSRFTTVSHLLLSSPPLFRGLHTGSGVGAFLLGFTKAIVHSTSLHLLLRRRCCLCDFTQALLCTFDRIRGWFSIYTLSPRVDCCCLIDGLLACFFHELTYNQTGGFDHSVFDTFVQLAEGRSARDQPKQLPAKKLAHSMWWGLLAGVWAAVSQYLTGSKAGWLSAGGRVNSMATWRRLQQ